MHANAFERRCPHKQTRRVYTKRLRYVLEKPHWLDQHGLEVYAHAQTFIQQLESVVARWEGGDLGMLQPVAPWPHGPLTIIYVLLKQMISKKELELLGVSSGTGVASGRDMATLDNTLASATTKDTT